MLAIIKSEFKKNKHNTQVYLSLAMLVAVQIILMTIVIKSFHLSGFGELDTTDFRRRLLCFASFSYLFTIFAGAIIGYHFISKEYLNNTWELLILGIKNKSKVICSKFMTAMIFYLFYQVLAITGFTMITKTYFKNEIEWSFFFVVLMATVTCNLLFYVLQLSAHFLIPNAMTALTFSLLLVIIPIFLGKSMLFTEIIPLMSISYIVTSMEFSISHFILLACWTIIVSSLTIIGVSKYFRL